MSGLVRLREATLAVLVAYGLGFGLLVLLAASTSWD